MKTQAWKLENAPTTTRSIVKCGSPQPLLWGDEDPAAAQNARGLAQFKIWRTLVASLVFQIVAITVHAQSYIDWFTLHAGGGSSAGGVYSASGSVGQPDANPQSLTGGNFAFVGGLWSLLAVQTPDGQQNHNGFHPTESTRPTAEYKASLKIHPVFMNRGGLQQLIDMKLYEVDVDPTHLVKTADLILKSKLNYGGKVALNSPQN
jgi:hypothetical protein